MTDRQPAPGKLYVITAPSGAGKTTLVKQLVEQRPGLCFSVSYTTRPRRTGELEGHDYFFVSAERFREMREAGEFLESATVFGHSYGTGKGQVRKLLSAGHDVLLEIDWQGARQVRENQPDCVSLFILPPSLEELERRLRNRRTDTDEVIARRLAEARGDISHWQEFDYAVINDDLDRAVAEALAILDGRGDAQSTRDPALRARVQALLASG